MDKHEEEQRRIRAMLSPCWDKSHDKDFFDALLAAITAADEHKKTQFVFRERSDDHWWHSGFLPENAKDFYVLYPGGRFDRSDGAPVIESSAWAEFIGSSSASPNAVLEATKESESPENRERRNAILDEHYDAKPQATKGWTGFMKPFLGFCAFAPFVMLGMGFILNRIAPGMDPWQLSLIPLGLCIPFSLFMLIHAMNHKDPKQGWTSSTLLSNAHIVTYGLAYFMARLPELPNELDIDHRLVMAAIMMCLAASGAGLLILWDANNKEKAR